MPVGGRGGSGGGSARFVLLFVVDGGDCTAFASAVVVGGGDCSAFASAVVVGGEADSRNTICATANRVIPSAIHHNFITASR